ncbi:hypothetical protein CEXT_118411 [Caerostris extrusa]|uniref:Uncharacterized protein n=1 Tax=Caerostris extrusa TaxID=172846 RepID=A0AAV4UGJ6_CAEEX|nr:hypothetical protein CEXT_118411 [Caerostris extrusa]
MEEKRSVFMQEERLHFQCTIFKKHSSQNTSRCWKQALARHSKTSGQKSASSNHERGSSATKKSIQIALSEPRDFDRSTANARHTEMSSLFRDIRWGWKFVTRRDFCIRGKVIRGGWTGIEEVKEIPRPKKGMADALCTWLVGPGEENCPLRKTIFCRRLSRGKMGNREKFHRGLILGRGVGWRSLCESRIGWMVCFAMMDG